MSPPTPACPLCPDLRGARGGCARRCLRRCSWVRLNSGRLNSGRCSFGNCGSLLCTRARCGQTNHVHSSASAVSVCCAQDLEAEWHHLLTFSARLSRMAGYSSSGAIGVKRISGLTSNDMGLEDTLNAGAIRAATTATSATARLDVQPSSKRPKGPAKPAYDFDARRQVAASLPVRPSSSSSVGRPAQLAPVFMAQAGPAPPYPGQAKARGRPRTNKGQWPCPKCDAKMKTKAALHGALFLSYKIRAIGSLWLPSL